MSSTAITFTIDSARGLAASLPFSLRSLEPFVVSPAFTGEATLSFTHNDVLIASADAINGSGTIDLSTTAAIDLFAGLPTPYDIPVFAELWDDDNDRPIASGYVTLANSNAPGRSTLRVGGGELLVTLAATLPAGTPVMLDDSHEAAACLAANAHRFIGILRQGGDTGDTVHVVTAGLVQVTAWPTLTTLAPGQAYYLSRTAGELVATAPDGYNVRLIGIAVDAATLVLSNSPVIQTLASGAHFLTWEPTTRRMLATAPAAASTGAPDADRIPCLDATGKLSATFLPDMTADSIAALQAKFSSLSALSDPTGPETVALVNALLSILKTGA